MQLTKVKLDMLRAANEKPLPTKELRKYNSRLITISDTMFQAELSYLHKYGFLRTTKEGVVYITEEGQIELKNHEPDTVSENVFNPPPQPPLQEVKRNKKRFEFALSDTGWKIFLITAIYGAGHVVGYFHN